MTTPEFPRLHPHRAAASGEPAAAADTAELPSAFVATLRRIGQGVAADGQPWPERQLMPGRQQALADAECALAGLRVGLEMLLAAERIRQNGPPHDHPGDRVVEGLMMACLAMTAQISTRLRPEG
ncbi:hypothetical protein [Stenotrophomonas maltophilia]|uniref:hypothetical protein n=1 Tax=Stenotrophomonas maltophilia TaxID=40324 RepID=UPI0034DB2D0A